VFSRFRGGSLFRVDPELRSYRSKVAGRAILGVAFLLALWIAIDGIFWMQGIRQPGSSYFLDVLLIAFLGAALFLAERTRRWGNVPRAAYILAGSLLILTWFTFLLFPAWLLPITPLLFLPILIVGSAVGGLATFLISALASLSLLAAWYLASPGGEVLLPNSTISALQPFVLGQIALHQIMAILLYGFSRHNELSIKRLRQQTEKLAEMAHTDPLTGLANRRHLIEQLDREFTRARRYQRPLSLLYLDLDGFKAINDHFGHLFGDEILRNAAVSMRSVLRTTDLLARIGGDEFAVLLPETTIKGAMGVANKLRRALTAFSANLGTAVPILTFSAGVAQMRPEDESFDDLLARADDIQYQAKSAGRGQIRSQLDISQLPLFNQTEPPSDN